MKKFALLFICVFTMASCSIEDDGPSMNYAWAKVVDADLPENFEKGKTYQIKFTYLLPSACHTGMGLDAKRGSFAGEERRDIYVVGVTSYDPNVTNCTIESENLEREKTITLTIDEDEPFTFYLWDGLDDEEESKYIVIEVPVVNPNNNSVE